MKFLLEAADFITNPEKHPALPPQLRNVAAWRQRGLKPPPPPRRGKRRPFRARCSGIEFAQILRVLDARVGGIRLSQLFEDTVIYCHSLMYSDQTYAELTAEGERILQLYAQVLAIMFPLQRPTTEEDWYKAYAQKASAADQEAIAAIAFRSWDVAFFSSAYVGLRHGAQVRRIIRDPSVAELMHEEGGEHAWTWLYFFVSLIGIAVSDGPHEADAIAFVIFGGSIAGNPPFSARGRRVREVNRTYARVGGQMDPTS